MNKKTSKLAVASLIVFVVSIIGLVITDLLHRSVIDSDSFCVRLVGSVRVFGYSYDFISFLFYASLALVIIYLFLILIKRHQLKGPAYSLIVLILTSTIFWTFPLFDSPQPLNSYNVYGYPQCRFNVELLGAVVVFYGLIAFSLFYASFALAIISLFLILIKRHQLKGLVYPLIVLILTTTIWIYPLLNPPQSFNKCSGLEKAIFFEFPHYDDKSLNPDDEKDPARGSCTVNFYSPDASDQIVDYYRGQLQNHGWDIKEDKGNARDGTPHVGFLTQRQILAEREGFLYYVSANQSLSGKTTEVRIGIQKMK